MLTVKNKTYELYSKDILKLLNGKEKCLQDQVAKCMKVSKAEICGVSDFKDTMNFIKL